MKITSRINKIWSLPIGAKIFQTRNEKSDVIGQLIQTSHIITLLHTVKILFILYYRLRINSLLFTLQACYLVFTRLLGLPVGGNNCYI